MYKITLIIAEAEKKTKKKFKSYLKFIVFVCGVFSMIKGTGSVISSDPVWKAFTGTVVNQALSLWLVGRLKLLLQSLLWEICPKLSLVFISGHKNCSSHL